MAFDKNALIQRVQEVLKNPVGVWQTISQEPSDPKPVLVNYVLPLLGLSAVSSFLSAAVVGIPTPFLGTIRIPVGSALWNSLLQLLLSLVFLVLFSLAFNYWAPRFQGSTSKERCFQLLAYSSTAGLIGSILAIVPVLGWLAAIGLGIYGLYTLYQGITPMTGVPASERLKFFGASFLSAVVLAVVVNLLAMPLRSKGFTLTTENGVYDEKSVEKFTKDAEEFSKGAQQLLKSLPIPQDGR